MSDTILSGDFTVYYTNDTGGDKQIKWTGSSGTYTVNQLYSAIEDLFDNNTGGVGDHMDEGIPISATTPSQYVIGQIETNDSEPWFIDDTSTQHLSGGSIETTGWTRDRSGHTNIGIIRFAYTYSTNFSSSDIGSTVTSGDSDSGKLLDFHQTVSGTWEAFVRPDSSVAANDWDSQTTVSGGSSSGVTMSEVPTTGESIWANIYTIGSIYSGTNIYVYQDHSKVTSWWSTGHIDILVLIYKDSAYIDLADPSVTSSGGILTIFAREYGYLYDDYVLTATGGRNPIPLATSSDVNNQTAIGTIAAISGVTITFGATSQDIGDGGSNQPYDVLVDLGSNTLHLDDFYEWTKYITRRTATTPLSTDYGYNGEEYITVGETRLAYDTQTANFAEGAIVTGATSGATGVIVADHDNGTSGTLILKDVRGTFDDSTPEVITDDQTPTPGSATITSSSLETTLVSKVAPFGTYAGGKFFGARGVWIQDMHADDAGNYTLIDSNGVSRTPPTSVSIVVNGLVSGDRVTVFRADSNNNINKSYLTSAASPANQIGDPDFVINEDLSTAAKDTPLAGSLRIVDNNGSPTLSKEYRVRYSSWSTSTFTLANQTGTMDDSGGTTTSTNLHQSGKSFTTSVEVGDLILNTSQSNAVSYVTAIVDNENLTIYPAISGQAAGDNYEINAVPIDTDTGDTAYVPYIDKESTGSSVSQSVTYDSDRNVLTRVRITGIVPYSLAGQLTSSGYTTTAIRNTDDIA